MKKSTRKNKIKILIPNNNEIKYTLKIVFEEWLGLEYEINNYIGKNIILKSGSRKIYLSDEIFNAINKKWLSDSILREIRIKKMVFLQIPNILKILYNKSKIMYYEKYSTIPVIALNDDRIFIEIENGTIFTNIDILGNIFFTLSRYEEAINKSYDEHNRYWPYASILVKNNIIERPICNEYLELLWVMVKYINPNLTRKEMYFNVNPSHDVDLPLEMLRISKKLVLRNFVGDILKRKSVVLFLHRFITIFAYLFRYYKYDKYYTFKYIIKESKKRNLTSTFYFINNNKIKSIDGNYYLNEKSIINLIKDIYKSGFKIGIHGTYNSYNNDRILSSEIMSFKRIMKEYKVNISIESIRFHFLRFNILNTFDILESMRIKFDSTLYFPEFAGYRAGTCYSYSAYSLKKRKILNVVEKPLLIMDVTLVTNKYRIFANHKDTMNYVDTIKNNCKAFDGEFGVLWHNSSLYNIDLKRLYEYIIG